MKKRASRLASETLLALLVVLGLGAASCSSSAYHVLVETDPPGAVLFVNGIRQGVSPRKVTMSFAESDRVYLQVLRMGRTPSGSWYTPETIPDDERIVIRLTRN